MRKNGCCGKNGCDDKRRLVKGKAVEYVLRQGAEITDEKGEPIEGWKGWQVDFIGENFVLLRNGQEYASHVMGEE